MVHSQGPNCIYSKQEAGFVINSYPMEYTCSNFVSITTWICQSNSLSFWPHTAPAHHAYIRLSAPIPITNFWFQLILKTISQSTFPRTPSIITPQSTSKPYRNPTMSSTSPSLFISEPKFNRQNTLYHRLQYPIIQHYHTSYTNFKNRSSFRKLSVKCLFANEISHQDLNDVGPVKIEMKENPVEVVMRKLMETLKVLQKPAMTALIVGLLLVCDPNSALAASGGRVGGSSFSSRSSMSSSRSYSAPRMGAGSGFSYSVPYYAPSPFGGVFLGPAVGIGSSFFFVLTAFAAFVLVSGFLSDGSGSSVLSDTQKTTVLKLQVGLLGLGRSLQKDLNRIAETADTSTSEGLHYVLTETMLALLRHPDYCISSYSSFDVKKSMEDGEKRFNQLSIEERGKFDEETLVNVNSMKKQSSTMMRSTGFSNEYIVVTILVAAEGVHKLPTINSSRDLKEALQNLASIPSSRTMAVEVLWTPQNEADALSERELLEDYPLLRPL